MLSACQAGPSFLLPTDLPSQPDPTQTKPAEETTHPGPILAELSEPSTFVYKPNPDLPAGLQLQIEAEA